MSGLKSECPNYACPVDREAREHCGVDRKGDPDGTGSGASVDRLTAARRQKILLVNVADTSTIRGEFERGFFIKILLCDELHQRL